MGLDDVAITRHRGPAGEDVYTVRLADGRTYRVVGSENESSWHPGAEIEKVVAWEALGRPDFAKRVG